MATHAIKAGSPVRRYGQVIGVASQPIRAGQHVYSHNLVIGEFTRDHAFSIEARVTPMATQPATFRGIVRADGHFATRNYIGILTSVNCSATVARVRLPITSGATSIPKPWPRLRRSMAWWRSRMAPAVRSTPRAKAWPSCSAPWVASCAIPTLPAC